MNGKCFARLLSIPWLLCTVVLLFIVPQNVSSFVPIPRTEYDVWVRSHAFRLKAASGNWDDNYRQLQSIQERQTQSALVDALFEDDTTATSLLTIQLTGQGRLDLSSNRTTSTASSTQRIILVLTPKGEGETMSSSLLLPLASNQQLKLVSFAAARRSLSKSVLLSLNTLLVNRDGALFDNLPWSTWSVDPQKRNRDAANNPIAKLFHLGKRDAYNRFIGKDWQGRSLAIGNLALRLKYMLEDTLANEDPQEANEVDDGESKKALAIRVLQLQIRELQMELADIDSQLAIAGNTDGSNLIDLEEQRAGIKSRIGNAQNDLEIVAQAPKNFVSRVSDILDRVAQWTTDDGENAAPYRGAMGYAPKLDSKDDIEGGRLPYTSPYDLLKEILQDQLNAKVIGCVLENTSLLRGNIALGGAVILQRITPTKSTEISGEKIIYNDYEETYGNQRLKAGETMIVECDGDEAIAVALAHRVPLKVASNLFEAVYVPSEPVETTGEKSNNIIEVLPMWRPVDPDLSLSVEGEQEQESAKTSAVSIPRTTTSLFDSISEPKPAGSSMFPDDNPIKSLDDFDGMSNEDKAKALLEMSNFSGRLPRPRVVRTSETNPLDKLMLPLIDESTRRQYLIRDAEQRGDMEAAAELGASKSRRQEFKEKAKTARTLGEDDMANQLETEAEFLEGLRADATQDEGAYSRFLDQDEWYERDRQATAKRVKKSSFGNLLDGIE